MQGVEAGAGHGRGAGGDAGSGAPGQVAHLDIHFSELYIAIHFQVINGWEVSQAVGVLQ